MLRQRPQWISFACWLLLLAVASEAQATDALGWMNPELTALRLEKAALETEAASWGPITFGPTSPEIGAQYLMVPTPPPESPTVQLDLGEVRRVDSITLVPAMLNFKSAERKAYAFPRGFRVDASQEADFKTFEPLFSTGELDFNADDGLPLVIPTPGLDTRYLRVTVTRLARVAKMWSFALGEIIVLSGNHNLARDAEVTMTGSTSLRPIWATEYLNDGRMPLGPPITPELCEFDGLYNDPETSAAADGNWMVLDLGTAMPIHVIRLYPVHARQGADYPGYAFPARFKIESSLNESFDKADLIFSTGESPFPNPGNNPVCLRATETTARYIRIACLESSTPRKGRFGLSEVAVYSEESNVARSAKVTVSGDTKNRPPDILVDGYTSYGKLIELPQWIDQWKRRREVSLRLQPLDQQIDLANQTAQTRFVWVAGTMLVGGLMALIGIVFWRGRQRRIDQRQFRIGLAEDLHDEIGSNLAAIARLGELAGLEQKPASESTDWNSVRQMAVECTVAMQETLWLLGGRHQPTGDLVDRFQQMSQRMLPDVTFHWQREDHGMTYRMEESCHRELFLTFKEIIANIAKHSRATQVDVLARANEDQWTIRVHDNGSGFDTRDSETGMGLGSIRRRVEKIGGHFAVTSQGMSSENQGGTTISISIPIPQGQRNSGHAK